MRPKIALASSASLLVHLLLVATVAAAQSKPIPIGVKVEAEGGGRSQGMWIQAAYDVSAAEANTLQRLIVAELRKQPFIEIVQLNYPDNFTGIAVVAAKLPTTGHRQWYVASSALLVCSKSGSDGLVSHDVVVGRDLTSVARSIAALFASMRFRATLDLLNTNTQH